jgi:hypothetical protein
MYTAAKRAVKAVVPEGTWKRFYARHYRTIRPLIVDYCPVMFPWVGRRERDKPIVALHRIATDPPDVHRLSPGSVVMRSIGCLVWPLRLLSSAGEQLWIYGAFVKREYGVGWLSQLAGMLRIAVSSNIAPVSYYRFRLFDPRNARRAHEYLQADELDALHVVLTSRLPSLEPLDDKELFFKEGHDRGLPVVPIIASFDAEASPHWYRTDSLPACDLILKPAHELCGRGVERWRWVPASSSWRNGDRTVDAAAFLGHCRDAGRIKKQVLQARVENHSALAPLAPGGLATLRVVTFKRPSGQSGVIMSGLRMPTAGQCVDNFAAGGIGAAVDRRGMLREGVAKDPSRGTFKRHPDSGAMIEGTQVPHYDEAIALALRAHAAFSWVPTVGWDIVITPDGPYLLEANPDWCYELAQIVPDMPLGATPYAEVFLEHLAAQSR